MTISLYNNRIKFFKNLILKIISLEAKYFSKYIREVGANTGGKNWSQRQK